MGEEQGGWGEKREESRISNTLSFILVTEALYHRHFKGSVFGDEAGEGEGEGFIEKGDIDFFSLDAKFPSPAGWAVES
jgi:hypothetical protein